jgi:hypothetical protein
MLFGYDIDTILTIGKALLAVASAIAALVAIF